MKSTKAVQKIFAQEFVQYKAHKFMASTVHAEGDRRSAGAYYETAELFKHTCEVLLGIFPDLDDIDTDALIDVAIQLQEIEYDNYRNGNVSNMIA